MVNAGTSSPNAGSFTAWLWDARQLAVSEMCISSVPGRVKWDFEISKSMTQKLKRTLITKCANSSTGTAAAVIPRTN